MKKNIFLRTLSLCVVTSSLVITSQVSAAGDPARGKSISSSCAACHGADGNSSVPTFPNLAGQHEAYLVTAITAYKTGTRKAPMMQPMAAGLSDQDIKDLAAFYASQKPKQ